MSELISQLTNLARVTGSPEADLTIGSKGAEVESIQKKYLYKEKLPFNFEKAKVPQGDERKN